MPTFDQVVHAKAVEIGKLAVRAITAAGSGHPSTALSLAHITTILMYNTMRWDPEHPQHRGSDRLVLSEGHAVPIIYAACADIGVTFYPGGKAKIMDVADLMTLRDIKSPIDGHPNPQVGFPFFDAATGSLGQGLSAAGGLGAAARVDKHSKVIYCIIGDGESREGQIWEAMDFIAEHELTNVVAIFNSNEIAQSDYVAPQQTADHLAAKAEAFGWKTVIVDGHNPTDLMTALKLRTEAMVAGKPLCIVAKTVKGWGTASQQVLGHRGTPVPKKDLAAVLAELDRTGAALGIGKVTPDDMKRVFPVRSPKTGPIHNAAHRAKASLADNLTECEAGSAGVVALGRVGFPVTSRTCLSHDTSHTCETDVSECNNGRVPTNVDFRDERSPNEKTSNHASRKCPVFYRIILLMLVAAAILGFFLGRADWFKLLVVAPVAALISKDVSFATLIAIVRAFHTGRH